MNSTSFHTTKRSLFLLILFTIASSSPLSALTTKDITVTKLQTFLEQKGLLIMPTGDTKGNLGPKTKQALIAYQKSVGLPASGVFGNLTKQKIVEALINPTDSTNTITQSTTTTSTALTQLTSNKPLTENDLAVRLQAIYKMIADSQRINQLSNTNITGGSISGASISGSSISGLTSDSVAEGSNLYYTNSRADARLSATSSLPNITSLSGLTSIGTSGGTTTLNGNVTIGTSVPTIIGSLTATTPALSAGGNTPSGILSSANFHGAISGDSLFFDTFHDENTFISFTTGGYASYDSMANVASLGAAPNHIHAFQNRLIYSGSVALPDFSGFSQQPVINGPVIASVGMWVRNATGSGTLTSQYGLFCESLTKGSANYCIWDNGPSPAYLGGGWRVVNSAALTTANLLLANNVPIWWSSTTGYYGAVDTELSRVAPGVVGVGTPGGATLGKIAVAQVTPLASTDACTAGSIWTDVAYIYVCTATGVIKRVVLSAF